jgi:hypothetical protein
MNGYSSVFWFSLCASLSALGLVLTVAFGRRRSTRSMLHGAAWSLIPIAAYMTGSTLMFWRIGEAIGKFASSFVFLPLRWAGIGVAGLIVVLFIAGGSRARRKAARGARAARRTERAAKREAAAGGGKAPVTSGGIGVLGTAGTGTVSATPRAGVPATRDPEPARRAKAGGKSADNDDMADIEEILRKRGILPARRKCVGSHLRQSVGMMITPL